MAGIPDQEGALTGENIAFVFPDGVTCITGEFCDEAFVRGRYGRLVSPLGPRQEKAVASIDKRPGCNVCVTASSTSISAPLAGELAAELLVRDEYECERVEVRQSSCGSERAGWGLFTRRPLHKGEIFSFYNGVRLSHAEVDARDWSLNERTATLDKDTVLDVPLEFASTDKYCASLGHFANHSRKPNAHYSSGFLHPRFGEIVCLRAKRDIEKDEEIFCDYAYEHEAVTAEGEVVQDIPAWFAGERRASGEASERELRRAQ